MRRLQVSALLVARRRSLVAWRWSTTELGEQSVMTNSQSTAQKSSAGCSDLRTPSKM
ncbi:hypothetical protein DPMN_034109 [Dreissena polymorpha]|uniref:Uncharacterized protein n=1 Tax=Dreissena polymorpha TaxID=45954 RepID=A0A9D4RLM4_DREPO|nr:hypothetical protein DPMN_034109 [Dreissena polymorpha]